MNKNKKNPLRKRVIRDFLGDWKKYLVVSLFLIMMIGFISGMYVANGSMTKSIEDGYKKYNLEDGHFEVKKELNENQLNAMKKGQKANTSLNDSDSKEKPVNIYRFFFRNEKEDNNNDGVNDATVRVYQRTDNINCANIFEGKLPKSEDEIAIDRMHADNAGLKVGDKIRIGSETYKICGLIAYVNYATLHEKNTDLTFDAIRFNVAMLSKKGFEKLNSPIHYSYAWKYIKKVSDSKEEKKYADNFLKNLTTQSMVAENEIIDFLPVYENQAVQFAPKDIGGDKAIGGGLLYVLMVVIGFIFAVTIINTITKEASAIGTLRASGYTKAELVRHYISVPVLVTLFSAIIGNILGYTVFKKMVSDMYYNSYSLPVFKTIWNADAFVKTTLFPLIIMVLINLVVIIRMMQYSPLQFLRQDFQKNKRKKAVKLPRWSFFSRFRLRIVLQNKINYLILFFGVLFVAIMLAMAVGMPDTLQHYKKNASDMMLSDYQYILKTYKTDYGFVTTKNKTAEKFSMKTLERKTKQLKEEVTIYGISDSSRYVQIKELNRLKEKEVYISSAYQEKYDVKIGDKITLDEKFQKKTYQFKVAGIYNRSGNIAIFMKQSYFNSIFGEEKNAFSGFLSKTKIKDLSQKQIATIITKKEITNLSDQMDHSLGSYMTYFQFLCIVLSAILIYLLTKIIIEKNEKSISMTKIFGYYNKEISGLYIVSTTIVLLIADFISVILGAKLMVVIWKMMMLSYTGWLKFVISPIGYVKMFVFILIGYLLVMALDYNRIRKIPLDVALKNIE